MSNATSPAAPDHAAEYTRADNAIRSLVRAADAFRLAMEALDEVYDDALAREARTDATIGLRRVEGLIMRNTARRDAAEWAQRAL